MSNRKRLSRERLEIYLVHLLLAYRRLVLICGILLLLYAIGISFVSPLTAGILGIIAAIPILVGNSYHAVVLTARFGAWIGTLGREE